MKVLITKSMRVVALCSAVSVFAAAPAYAQDHAKIDMSHLDKFAERADKVINVTVDEQLLRLAASFLSDKKPDEAKIKENRANFEERFLANKRQLVFYEWLHDRQRDAGLRTAPDETQPAPAPKNS